VAIAPSGVPRRYKTTQYTQALYTLLHAKCNIGQVSLDLRPSQGYVKVEGPLSPGWAHPEPDWRAKWHTRFDF